MKKNLALLLLVAIILSSCATLTAKKEYGVKIYSESSNAQVIVNDSTYALPATVKVKRSKEDLAVRLVTDSITKDFIIKASPSPAFIYGNLVFMQAFPVGHFVDFNTQKRFYYGKKIALNVYDSLTTITPPLAKGYIDFFSRKFLTQKGQVNVTVSIPYANHFQMRPRSEPLKNIDGFFGISTGVEYYYRDRKYIKLNAGYTIDFEAPILLPIEFFSVHETVEALNVTLTDNFKFNRFTVGYGLNYAIYTWQIVNDDYKFPYTVMPIDEVYPFDNRPPQKKNSHSLGLTVNGYFQITKGLFVGIIYNPTLYNIFPEKKYQYQHVMSLDVMWKFTPWKGE